MIIYYYSLKIGIIRVVTLLLSFFQFLLLSFISVLLFKSIFIYTARSETVIYLLY